MAGKEAAARQQDEAESAVAAAKHETAAPTSKPVREWSVDDVQAFLAVLELDVYTAAIRTEKVDGRMLQDLVAEDGLGDLGIKSKVHVLRIKRGLEKVAEDLAAGTGAQATEAQQLSVGELSRAGERR